jgi:superfamily II DNA or RNA helicase/diadenosine tetraphosphate (Ap4A) HIT family hydrolase/HKD family nuclease
VTEIGSPFLEVPAAEWVASNRAGFAIRDGYPVTPGHTLVVSHRQIATWWDATPEERVGLWSLVDVVKEGLDRLYQPHGYNVGFNAGAAAGQTVAHLHIHVIPRHLGDVADPTGGIRHVIPGRGNYLAAPQPELPPLVDGQERTLRLELVACLRSGRFDRIDLVVSFIMKSGLAMISRQLEDAITRGAYARILTTDYFQITDPDALTQLLDLADVLGDALTVRVFHDDTTSFHPKAYLFWSSDGTIARGFVGSSNLSQSGIDGGVEWSVGIDQVGPLITGFERLWNDARSHPLTHELLGEYRARWRPDRLVPGEVQPEASTPTPTPRPIQREALFALEQTRHAGHTAGLVVMATGLGKTWLAAFDTARPSFRRILFVAHREEILRQSRDVFRRVQPDADLGLFAGAEKNPGARIVFASVQTLAGRLNTFDADEFDYIVVDEFHHAAARTYRTLLGHFRPRFLLGLTATPERLDGADLLALCDDNLVYECSLVEAINSGELARFNYFGIKDTVDYRPIPWRNGQFEPEALTDAVSTDTRAQQALDEWRAKGGGATLGFCVTTRHADYMAEFFRNAGVDAVAVHTGPSSAPRGEAIANLKAGNVDVVFSVDVFNEGLDVPEINTVLMLRPTQSPVVFLQQLGRGLRRTDRKDSVAGIDFIGNHRSFLLKPRVLLAAATGERPSNAELVERVRSGDFELPTGCSAIFDIEAIELLEQLARIGVRDALEEFCRSYTAEEGRRPTAIQAWRAGHNPAAARSAHGGWFGLLDHLELLDTDEASVWRAQRDVLTGFEVDAATKSYKLVTLKALLQDQTLRSGSSITQLAWTSHRIVAGDPRLVADTQSDTAMPDPVHADQVTWRAFWRRWPLAAWTGELRGQPGRWFRIEGERFVPTFRVEDGHASTLDAMVAELVDWRLARYLFNKQPEDTSAVRLRVSQSNGRPLVWLERERNPGLPEGRVEFIADGDHYVGNFVKIALNRAHRRGSATNDLHALLRTWFGESAGLPGTEQYVELRRDKEGWELKPVRHESAKEAADEAG